LALTGRWPLSFFLPKTLASLLLKPVYRQVFDSTEAPMRIAANPLHSDMLSMLREAQSGIAGLGRDPLVALQEGGAGAVGSAAGERFAVMLRAAVDNVNSLQQTSGDLQTRFDSGDRSLSLSDVMIASQKSSLAFSATVQVRNKLVEAYKEIMGMSV